MIKLKNKENKVLVLLRANDFPLYLEGVEVEDMNIKELRDYKLYRGKKGTVNLGRSDKKIEG